MTNIEKIEKDYITKLNVLVKAELSEDCYIWMLCRNYVSIMFITGTINLHHNGGIAKFEIKNNDQLFELKNKNQIEFYWAVNKFLEDKKFQRKFMKKFMEFKKLADEMVENGRYCKENI